MRDLTLVSYKMIRQRKKERDRVNNHHQRRKVGGAAQNRNDNVA